MNAHDSAEKALRMVREAPELVYDTETSGLDWKRNFPIGYVVGADARNVVYVPVRHGGGGNLPGAKLTPQTPTDKWDVHPFEVALAKAFDDRNRTKQGRIVGHYIKFDCHFSANAGVMLGRDLTCTQNNEALLNEYSRSFSLDACALAHGVAAKKGQLMYDHIAKLFNCPADKKSMGDYWRLAGNDPIAVEYAIGDGVSTIEVFGRQIEQIVDQSLEQVFNMENELIWTLFRMERRGIKVDTEYLGRLKDHLTNKIDAALKALPKDFNTRSPKDVRNYVSEAGHTDWPLTEKGNPSFKEDWLETFEAGQHIVAVRKWTNLRNTWVTPMLEEHVVNGRVHTNLNQLKADDTGTVSGRLSCSNPSLHGTPKRDKEVGSLLRRCYVADESMLLHDDDYSQCEPRLYGHYSGEPAIVNGYNSTPPKDMHAVVAEMLGVERDPTAKRMNMGIMTGMFPKSFAGHMDWDIATATEKWDAWFRAFPAIRDFQNQAKKVLNQREFVRTLLGRKCRLEKPRFAYRAVSKIIQGGNADILKWNMLELDKMCEAEGDLVHMLLSIHDAFQWQAPNTPEGEAFSREMEHQMCRVQEPPFNLNVPFVVDSGSGPDWARATYGDKCLEFIKEID